MQPTLDAIRHALAHKAVSELAEEVVTEVERKEEEARGDLWKARRADEKRRGMGGR